MTGSNLVSLSEEFAKGKIEVYYSEWSKQMSKMFSNGNKR